MSRKKVLVLADLGGCPPNHFYKSVAEKYNIVSYIPRPFAITKEHFDFINKYSIAVVSEEEYFESINDFDKNEEIYWAMESHLQDEESVSKKIEELALFFNVDAITTNNELFVVPIARASEKLGLKGAGYQAAINARDKYLMRNLFNETELKTVKCYQVNSLEDLKYAQENLSSPFILKPTYLASSLGVTLVHKNDNIKELFIKLENFISNIPVPNSVNATCKFIAEEYLIGDSEAWYGDNDHGDYVSIEGVLKDGNYVPISITDKAPLIGFTETSQISPTILDFKKQKIIAEAAKIANESLGLENCATHTEMKLLPGLEVGLIETAARFGGWNIIPNIDKVKGINFPELLMDVLTCSKIDLELSEYFKIKKKYYISDFHLYANDDPNFQKDMTFKGIKDVSQYVLDGVDILNYTEADTDKLLVFNGFKAFNAVCSFELKSKDGLLLIKSINNIRKHFRLNM